MKKNSRSWTNVEGILWNYSILQKFVEGIILSRRHNNKIFNMFKKWGRSFILAPYYVIGVTPTIIMTVWDFWNRYRLFSEMPRGRKAYFLFICYSCMESEEVVEKIRNGYASHKDRYPDHELVYLCNSPKQYELFKKFEFPCIFCNHNAFVDENIYKIIPDAEKKYNAIYNAAMFPCKRHFLASKVKNLALITYAWCDTREYINETKKALQGAIWINKPVPYPYDFIPEEEIHKYLNQARVGLYLSASEGAVYASAEYLLCGLPVVSTRSSGGRDVFFDDEYVKVVGDTPEAVKEGVEEMIERNVSPYYIREKTLEKMEPHRERFVALIQSIYDKENVDKDFKKEWGNVFVNQMIKWGKMRSFKRDIQRKVLREQNKRD